MVKIKHHIMTNIRKDLFADVNIVGSRYFTVGHLNIEQKQAEQSHSSDQTMSHPRPPYLTLTGELLGVSSGLFGENMSRNMERAIVYCVTISHKPFGLKHKNI